MDYYNFFLINLLLMGSSTGFNFKIALYVILEMDYSDYNIFISINTLDINYVRFFFISKL